VSLLKAHYDKVSALGCIVCRNAGFYVPAELHHPYGRKHGHEMEVVGLCFAHHRSGCNTALFTSVHPYRKKFYALYGSPDELLRQVAELIK
jgi:hypothetical protein